MNILLLLAHSIEEHDQIKLLSELGYDVFSIGGYIDPAAPHDPKRPALPDAPRHPELQAVVDGLGTRDNLDAAKRHIPDEIIDWADVIICHHYEHQWIVPQWERIKHKRVIWRTVGQSVEGNERMMAPLRSEGLQIVRYSPKEANIPGYAGHEALIRFYKDPDEWCGWTGDWLLDHNDLGPIVGADKGVPFVVNFTQHLAQREPYTNYGFWKAATEGLPAVTAGPGSEAIKGLGELSVEMMQKVLRGARCYLYTGTQPASYTLGLIEALMTGIPIVSIGPAWMRIFPYGPDLFEAAASDESWPENRMPPTIVASDSVFNDPTLARKALQDLLEYPDKAQNISQNQRRRAIEMFGKEKIGAEWKAFLG